MNTDNRSGRLNAICERYDAIIHDELQNMGLSRNEWCAIVDVGNGTALTDEVTWRGFWANMMDSPEMDEKWGVDHEDLARRMRIPTVAARAAIVEVVERFWRSPRLNKDSHDELLRAAGAVFSDTEEAA